MLLPKGPQNIKRQTLHTTIPNQAPNPWLWFYCSDSNEQSHPQSQTSCIKSIKLISYSHIDPKWPTVKQKHTGIHTAFQLQSQNVIITESKVRKRQFYQLHFKLMSELLKHVRQQCVILFPPLLMWTERSVAIGNTPQWGMCTQKKTAFWLLRQPFRANISRHNAEWGWTLL